MRRFIFWLVLLALGGCTGDDEEPRCADVCPPNEVVCHGGGGHHEPLTCTCNPPDERAFECLPTSCASLPCLAIACDLEGPLCTCEVAPRQYVSCRAD
jgi:hypothetical protein